MKKNNDFLYFLGSWITDERTLIQYLVLNPYNMGYHQQKIVCEKYGGFITEPRTEMENDFLVTLNTGSFFLGMSDVLEDGRWLWGSNHSEVTWNNWFTLPKGTQESPEYERNCAVMRRGGSDGDDFSGRSGWVDVGCGSKDMKSLICQRGKTR